MSDTQQKKTDPPFTTPDDEEEEIIDLLEEIPAGSIQRPMSALEQNLLGLEHQPPAQNRSAVDLPDIADLVGRDSDEADAAKDKTEGAIRVEPGPAAAPVPEEVGRTPAVPENEKGPLSEFGQRHFEADDLLDVEKILGGPGLEEKDPAPEEDEALELIDADEEEGDDEIVWFDDLDKKMTPPETGAETGPPQAEVPAVSMPIPAESGALPQAPPALSATEIEAAVERVIERKLGRTIESVIRQAIENAVSKEIERLKRLLLEDDSGATP